MPTDQSETKARSLLEVASKCEKDGDLQEAFTCYMSALDFLTPLLRYERSHVKRLEFKNKVAEIVQKAERIKYPRLQPATVGSKASPSSSSASSSLPKSSSFDDKKVKELVKLCSVTPQLKTALEIMQSAELYELEGQYPTALEKYQVALGMLLPALNKEPKGPRKTLLASETELWMSRAEKVKNVIAVQEKVLKDSAIGSESNDKCVIS